MINKLEIFNGSKVVNMDTFRCIADSYLFLYVVGRLSETIYFHLFIANIKIMKRMKKYSRNFV